MCLKALVCGTKPKLLTFIAFSELVSDYFLQTNSTLYFFDAMFPVLPAPKLEGVKAEKHFSDY